jgi:hypothetical protein
LRSNDRALASRAYRGNNRNDLASEDQPSPGLRRLLETKLDTYEKLELVVVLSRRDGATATLGDLARELQVGDDVLKRLATDLSRSGLVAIQKDLLQLAATPAELPVIEEGAQLYQSDRGKVISLMSTIAMDRIRGMAARSFADAFTLRKKKDTDDG